MNILILEDSEERIEIFKKAFQTLNVYVATEVDECIQQLKNTKWDFVFLDHDLGGKVFVDHNKEPTGYHVAEFLKNNPQYKPTKNIIIHSWNGSGIRNMKALLPEAIIRSFNPADYTNDQE